MAKSKIPFEGLINRFSGWVKSQKSIPFAQYFKKKLKAKGLLCVSFLEDGIAWAYRGEIAPDTPATESLLHGFEACSEDTRFETLGQLVQQHEWHGLPCSWVLQPEDYKLLMMEAPEMPLPEIRLSLPWLVAESIDFPATEACLDAFLLPRRVGGSKQSMHVIVAKLDHVKTTVEAIKACDLDLQVVDVPELCLRNLLPYIEGYVEGVGILHLRSKHNKVLVCRNGDLYLARNIRVTEQQLEDSDDQPEVLDNLVLEIQRSIDYYQSQLKQRPPVKILLTPMLTQYKNLESFVTENLATTFELLDLNTLLKCQPPVAQENQARCLTVLGGVLRLLNGESSDESVD